VQCAEQDASDEQTSTKPSISPLAALADSEPSAPTMEAGTSAPVAGAACAAVQSPDERRRSLILGVSAPLAAAALYGFQRANPINPLKLLAEMEARSPTLPDALASGSPTLVEFYAPWCVSCRESAPAMMRLERRFTGVNFVVCNAEDPRYAELVRLFGVDGIPHYALLDKSSKLAGTLVGEVPESVVESSLVALAADRPLPYGAEGAPGGAK